VHHPSSALNLRAATIFAEQSIPTSIIGIPLSESIFLFLLLVKKILFEFYFSGI
jgi:hypothetical protein